MRDFFHGVGKILTGPEGPAHDAIDNARDGTQKRKMIATMDCITGALKLAMLPAGSRKREFSGIRAAKRPTSRKMSTQEATAKERFSWGVMGFMASSEASISASKGQALRHHGSVTCSVTHQQTRMMGKVAAKAKEIIAQDVHFIRRVNELSRHLGEALNDGINGRRRVVCRKRAGNPGKGSGLRRQGVFSRSVER